VHRLERIGRCRPDLAIRIALTVAALDLYSQPEPPAPDPIVIELAAGNGLPQPTSAWVEGVAS
jgi:hypothetical protein